MNPNVLIIGGGSAGVAAAIAAARQGADTLLVERNGFFGGTGTASLVHSFCGLYVMPPTPDAAAKSRIQAFQSSWSMNCWHKESRTARCAWARSMC